MKIQYALVFLFIGLAVIASLAFFFYFSSFQFELDNVELDNVVLDKIGIIYLSGEIISSGEFPHVNTISTGELQRALENAHRDDKVKAIVLAVDSPGGLADASYEMYSMVKGFEKPIVAFIRGTGASGAYLVSLGADRIVANPFSIVGSIGVFIVLDKQVPVEPENVEEIFAITSGKLKNVWADGVLDENEREYLEMKVDEINDSFLNIIFQRTEINRADVENIEDNLENPIFQLAEGGWFNGEKALELKLVDSLGDMDSALELASELSGVELDEVDVVIIMPPPPGTYGNMLYETPLYRDNQIPPIYLK